MSFSSEIKEEMSKHMSTARHCQIAELAAILSFCGQYGRDENGNYTIGFLTENESVVTKGFTLLKKTYNIGTDDLIDDAQMQNLFKKVGDFDKPVSSSLLKNACCKRAFIRGTFLSVGSMSDPTKGYHLEFDCPDMPRANQLLELLKSFDIEAKCVQRKKYRVVYVKDGESIADILNVCEAHIALMNFENLRILKGIGNSINRRVNCEAANISKTAHAYTRQKADIEYLKDHYGFENLPDNLREMAEVRLEFPEASLKELGECLDPPVGKSGVNHRLRKLSEIADKVRSQKEE